MEPRDRARQPSFRRGSDDGAKDVARAAHRDRWRMQLPSAEPAHDVSRPAESIRSRKWASGPRSPGCLGHARIEAGEQVVANAVLEGPITPSDHGECAISVGWGAPGNSRIRGGACPSWGGSSPSVLPTRGARHAPSTSRRTPHPSLSVGIGDEHELETRFLPDASSIGRAAR